MWVLRFSKIEKTEVEVISELAPLNPCLLKVFPQAVSRLEDTIIIQLFQKPNFPVSEEALIKQLLDVVTKLPSNVSIIEKLNISWLLPYFAAYPDLWYDLSTETLTTLYTVESPFSTNFSKEDTTFQNENCCSRHRSICNFFVNLLAGLVAYTYLEKLPSLDIHPKGLPALPPAIF